MNMIRSKERVQDIGEVFTPPNIVSEMISLIPDDKWKDPSFIVLEPTCGSGNFLVAVVKKKLDCGLTPIQALNTTFGTDICPENIDEARHRLLSLVIKIKIRDKRTAVCIIHHNIFVVDDFLKATLAIQNKPFFTKTRGVPGPFLGKDKKEDIKNKIKSVRINNNFNFVERLENNLMISTTQIFDIFKGY